MSLTLLPGDCRWPVVGRRLCAVLRSHAGVGHDEYRQHARRFRDAHVRGVRGLHGFGAGPWLGRLPLAVLVLATLGVVDCLFRTDPRHHEKGRCWRKFSAPSGSSRALAALFWWFGANFLSLPENLVGGTFDLLGLRSGYLARLLAGTVALLVTLGLLPADAHLAGIENAGGRGGFDGGAADDGHPPRYHASDCLGDRPRVRRVWPVH